jgi:hypothetical protein
MNLSTFIVTVFTFIDDWFLNQRQPLRQRGCQPVLFDSEVLTMEVVGDFMGLHTDQELFTYFRRHWLAYFPRLARVHRTTFVRQSANLWVVKQALWRTLLGHIHFDPALSIVDSLPLPVCRLARAPRCRRLRECAAYGHDEVAGQLFFGLRVHVRLCWPGVITGFDLAPANVHELHVAEPLLADAHGWALGDRNYWSPELTRRLSDQGLHLLAPFRSQKREKQPWPLWLKRKRYRIEPVFSQLVERFRLKRVWARDRWHLCSRWLRSVLTYTFAVYLCQQNGLSSLRFAELVAH